MGHLLLDHTLVIFETRNRLSIGVVFCTDTAMTEQEPPPPAAVWGRATPPANHSLGPVDPSWLAKLSAHLGINPARTVASLLLSIWPGTGTGPVCCREACAFLMQVALHLTDACIKSIHSHIIST
jgi:hypothetical protein